MIQIRPFNETDCLARVNAINTPSVANGIFIETPADITRTIIWARGIQNQSNRRDFSLISDDKAVGFGGIVNIQQKNGTAELYIFINPSHANKGLGKHLLNFLLGFSKIELNLRKISIFVSSNNSDVLGFYEKMKFKKEGLLEKHAWHRGQYVDRYILAVFLESINFTQDDFYRSFIEK